VDKTICAPDSKARSYSLAKDGIAPAPLGASTDASSTCARPPICEIERAFMELRMNLRTSFVMIALAALVAGAAAVVYVHDVMSTKLAGQGAATAMAAGAANQSQKPLYDFNALPDPVKRMLEGIAAAAQSGEIEKMRPVLESNELKPMVAAAHVDDPIALWKKESADGSGRDVLAAMLNVMSSGYVRVGQGQDEMYVWPYFAETGLSALTPAQEVELYRIVPPQLAAAMKKSGKYGYYRLGIAPNGVWHYFLQ
jgi:hypothetical protein